MTKHPWKLVGPWYRTESVGGLGQNRNTAPILQKYADASFAGKLVEDPQHSLRFNSEDFVERIKQNPNEIIDLAERKNSHTPLKLFLDLHSRFYVVICELHCDVAGFPSVDRKQVCEAGMVIRRRVPIITPSVKGKISTLLRERQQLQSDLLAKQASIDSSEAIVQKQQLASEITVLDTIKARSAKLVHDVSKVSVESLNDKLRNTNEQLNEFIDKGDLQVVLQGWHSSELKGVGNWQNIEETPAELEEQTLPLYPVIADPTNHQHTATGKTLWFGLIPTSSGDIDSANAPKFDEKDLYEIRCFVRRYKPQFPLKTNEKDCCGDIVWSKATEGYQIASPYDLDGGSHRPVNIKLPDLPALKAQADAGPAGRGAGARIIAPENSSLNFATDKMDMPEGGEPLTRAGQQICFFAIFLFFIVAMFLFRLFLPILLFIFNLWFLLKLKFCIPPSIEFDAGLVADLSFDGSFGIEFDASIQAHVDLMADFSADLAVQMAIEGPDIEAKFAVPGYSITVNKDKDNEKTYTTAAQLSADLSLMIANGINATDDMTSEMVNGGDKGEGMNANLSLDELASIFVVMQTEYENSTHPELAGELPTAESGLVYFDRVENTKVAA